MTKPEKKDVLRDLQDWGEHQYNTPYWINRVGPFLPPRANWRNWLLAGFDLVLLTIPAIVLIVLLIRGEYDPAGLYIPIGLIIIGGVLSLLRFIRLRPRKRKPSQAMIEEWNREKKEEKKEQPRRRKDWK